MADKTDTCRERGDAASFRATVEACLQSLAGVNAVLADGQLALQRKDFGSQYGFGQEQQAEEAADIAQHLPSA